MPNFRRIGQVFLELRPSKRNEILPIKSDLTAILSLCHSLINNFSSNSARNLSDTFWKGLIKHYSLDL